MSFAMTRALLLWFVWSSPEEGGASFWVTLRYEQKHPEFLLNPREFAQLNMRWKAQTRVRMFWRSDDHPAGGECVPFPRVSRVCLRACGFVPGVVVDGVSNLHECGVKQVLYWRGDRAQRGP